MKRNKVAKSALAGFWDAALCTGGAVVVGIVIYLLVTWK